MLRCKFKFYQQALRKTHSSGSVTEFYDGQSVFITGGTGFVGKVLIEKLLYRCHGLDKIYVLVRDKNNIKSHQRLQKLFDEPVFSRLKNEKPEAFDKIIPILGDITEPKLGITPQSEKLLIEKVSIVFHVAASVKFNEPLEIAINNNLDGTERVLNLCQRLNSAKETTQDPFDDGREFGFDVDYDLIDKNDDDSSCNMIVCSLSRTGRKIIISFVHVSTAYCNADKEVIEEIVYPAPASLSEVKKIIENGVSEDQVNKLLDKQPNTYAFAKALAETLVTEKHNNIPTVIVRPSIISSCKSEPVVGWIDNWFGVTGVMTMIAKGFIRALLAKRGNIVDIIPADYVSNLIIVAAAKKSKCISKDVAVYNCSTSKENPLKVEVLRDMIIEDSYKNKAYDFLFPYVQFSRFKWMVSFITQTFQVIPAYVTDTILVVRGKKQRYKKISCKSIMIRDNVDFFTYNSWQISASKTKALAESLSPLDKKYFPFNPKDINWKEYIPTYCKGTRQFMWKNYS